MAEETPPSAPANETPDSISAELKRQPLWVRLAQLTHSRPFETITGLCSTAVLVGLGVMAVQSVLAESKNAARQHEEKCVDDAIDLENSTRDFAWDQTKNRDCKPATFLQQQAGKLDKDCSPSAEIRPAITIKMVTGQAHAQAMEMCPWMFRGIRMH